MKRKNRVPLIIGAVIVALFFSSIGFGIGYYRYSAEIAKEKLARQNNQKQLEALIKAQQNSIHNVNNDETMVTNYGDTISKETTILYKTRYTQCNDTIKETAEPTLELIGLNEKGLEKYIKENNSKWEIESFSKNEIVLVKMVNKVCPNHYLISVNNGYISIYKYEEDEEKVLIERTEVSIKNLPTVDQEKLQRGIIVETLEDVYQLLEDFSS